MKNGRICIFISLIVYSLILIGCEVKFSQSFVRNFFTDIKGPVFFYAVNTTLAVFLAWATALMFAACIKCIDNTKVKRKEFYFYLSQVLLFFYIGVDDRFLFHESMGRLLQVRDSYFVIILGILEVALIIKLGNFKSLSRCVRRYLYCAALFFSAMFIFDAFVSKEALLRLSIEDLSKTWGLLFVFLFAWSIFSEKITVFKNKLSSETKNRI